MLAQMLMTHLCMSVEEACKRKERRGVINGKVEKQIPKVQRVFFLKSSFYNPSKIPFTERS
jgi:hypothetical protein